MRLLILYGPNLNLLGVVSRRTGTRLTLDKFNRALQRTAREMDIELKICQTQSEAEASKMIQRQRNKIDGIVLVPGIWARTGHLLDETARIVRLPLAVFHLEPEPGPWHGKEESIFAENAVLEDSGDSPAAMSAFLKRFVDGLRS